MSGMMNPVDLLGYSAASCTTSAFLPQVLKAVRKKDTRSLSLGMDLIFTVGVGAWLAYGILKKNPAITLANGLTSILALAILVIKLR
jgi:MtN3 and saliva related transmembrane protein